MIVVIDRKEYEVSDDLDMSAGEIRELGNVAEGRDLWETIPGRCDLKVEGPEMFSMPKGMRRRFFTSPQFINNAACALCVAERG